MSVRTGHAPLGFSMVELLLALTVSALMLASLAEMVSQAGQLKTSAAAQNAAVKELQFAMNRMLEHAAHAERMLLPADDRPTTAFTNESVREETPGNGSAVLALTLPTSLDRDMDGWPDADNDRDGRIDEDTPADMTNDAAPGIVGIDDDMDLLIDEGLGLFVDDDDDEYLAIADEDALDLIDSDDDGTTDDDWPADRNNDGAPGVVGVDDDGDGLTDEGANADDDEDGSSDEDWLDVVLFEMTGTNLVERSAVPWDVDGDTDVDGRDYVENVILENVSRFRVERVAGVEGPGLVDITLTSVSKDGQERTLNSRIRIGSLR